MSNELVLAERRDAVLLLTLNRPDRLNAWNDALEAEYFDHLDAAEADPEVRIVVVTGAGRGFCAGADMDDLEAAGEGAPVTVQTRPRSRPLEFPKPLIAAINGSVAGLGLVEALYCDVRFSVPRAKILTAFVRRGLIAEYGSAWLLARLVGAGRALDLLMSGRTILGFEAFEMGLVNRLCGPEDLLDETLGYAADLATNCSPASMAAMKRQVLQGFQQTFAQSFDEAQEMMDASFARPDVREGVNSYLEKRPPAFPPLDPAVA